MPSPQKQALRHLLDVDLRVIEYNHMQIDADTAQQLHRKPYGVFCGGSGATRARHNAPHSIAHAATSHQASICEPPCEGSTSFRPMHDQCRRDLARSNALVAGFQGLSGRPQGSTGKPNGGKKSACARQRLGECQSVGLALPQVGLTIIVKLTALAKYGLPRSLTSWGWALRASCVRGRPTAAATEIELDSLRSGCAGLTPALCSSHDSRALCSYSCGGFVSVWMRGEQLYSYTPDYLQILDCGVRKTCI